MANYFADWNFDTIDNIDDLRTYSELSKIVISENESKDSKTVSSVINELLTKIHNQIKNKQASGISKFMSLMMLQDFTEKHILAQRKEDKMSKLFSVLASHPILKEIKLIALQTDPFKQVHEKGKSLFSQSATVGNDFVRLALQLVKYWGIKFPQTSKKEASSYKKNFEQLQAKKVILPNDYKFLAFANNKMEQSTNRQRASVEQKPIDNKNSQPGRNSSKSQVVLMYNRMLNFIQSLEEEPSAVQSEIRKNHALIKQEIKKFEAMQSEMGQIIDKDSQTFQKYICLLEFMHKELQYHDQYISSNNTDFQSYVIAIKLQGQKIFSQLSQPTPKDKAPSKPSRVSSKLKEQQEPPKQSAFDPKSMQTVNSYFHKLEERSKSPIAGFTKIKQTLSKQKASTLKKSVSPLNKKNTFTNSMTSLKESKISTIFANPPNPNPPIRNYEGREIHQNMALSTIMRSISKSQGMRRFKTANFKGKSSLFQNQHIQIGYKSQAIYEEISGFRVMIKIELFFGNLGDKTINDLSLEFKGDPNVLLYANPKIIERYLQPAQQNKIDLIIVPVKVPFPLLKMTVKYNYDISHEVVIPNSVLKLAHFMSVSKQEFNNRWIMSDIVKTEQFKLCHYLPPDSFKKWIPELGQLSSYTAFAAPGSKKDYQLYCAVIMLQRYEGLLKLNIRPNLEVVIQMGIQDSSEQSLQYCTYLLQTLQQFLKSQS